MSLPIVNSIASWFLKKRIHQIELFIKYPNEVQEELLFDLIKKAKNTEIGKLYDFKTIDSYQEFAKRVPIVNYEKIEPLITRSRKGERNIFWPSEIKWFAKSSGTTNAKSKFIPVSNESLEDCHYAGTKDLLCTYLNNNEGSKLFTGKGLRLGGSKELYEENGTYFGDLSAIIIDNMPFWAEMSSTPSSQISLMSDWETKMSAIVNETLKENVTSLAGVPSWMLVLLNEILATKKATNLSEIWPNLEVYFHGGVSFPPYKEQYNQILPEHCKYYEIYNASEGLFAIQDQNFSNELLLMLDYGIFYEFIDMDTYHSNAPKVYRLDQVTLDKNYAILITTNAGLWRYIVGDTIRFTSLSPYRIKISGRTKHYINVFGEELMIENVERALQETCIKTNADIVDFTVAPIFMEGRNKGAHEWLIEFKKKPASFKVFSHTLDLELQKLNSDYEAKRSNNITLNPLQLIIAQENLFYNWLKSKGKLGGQHKIPRLSNSRAYLDELLILNSKVIAV